MKAFPHPKPPIGTLEELNNINGMDLRDYFAAKAMQIVGLNWQLCDYGNGDKRMDETPAMLAYAIADAMMEARKK